MTATRERARATFLLQVALDEARTRQRIAAALLAARARLGGGDARRFPQPKMAEVLGVSLRTYQHWEAAETMPRWRNLEEIADRLEVDVSELVGSGDAGQATESDGSRDLQRQILEELSALRADLRRLLDADPPTDVHTQRAGRGSP
jgi:transcriptional regulator with XRE-family HTH domain